VSDIESVLDGELNQDNADTVEIENDLNSITESEGEEALLVDEKEETDIGLVEQELVDDTCPVVKVSGMLPEGVELRVVSVSEDYFRDNVSDEGKFVAAYDISLWLDYAEYQPESDINVEFLNVKYGEDLKVIHEHEEDVTEMDIVSEDGQNLQVNTEGFSVFGIVLGSGITHNHDSVDFETPITSPNELVDAASTGGEYYLTSNIDMSELTGTDGYYCIDVAKDFSLCLNGYSITGYGVDGIFFVTSDSTFRLYDCKSTGTITGGEFYAGGAVFIMSSSSFILNSGIICNNTATADSGSVDGAGVYNRGTFVMKGGTICNNTCIASADEVDSVHGGGVFNDIEATFTMTGGEISNNKCIYSGTSNIETAGGGVYSLDTISITGGSIHDNYVQGPKVLGNGILSMSLNKLTVGGTARIIDNVGVNTIGGNTLKGLKILDPLEGMSVGISTPEELKVGETYVFSDECDEDYSQYFFADQPYCSIFWDPNTKCLTIRCDGAPSVPSISSTSKSHIPENKNTGTAENPVSGGTWKAVDGVWYYSTGFAFCNTWGNIEYYDPKTGKKESGWFYFDDKGRMLTGWQNINGTWYYFENIDKDTLGKLVTNSTTPDGYFVDANGAWVQ